jgi:hypothetical protein
MTFLAVIMDFPTNFHVKCEIIRSIEEEERCGKIRTGFEKCEPGKETETRKTR